MALVNHNNGTAVTTTGTYCAIQANEPPTTVGSSGGDCELIKTIGWFIVGNASAAGTVNIQFNDPLDTTFRTPTTQPSPFPITVAANGVYEGTIVNLCHGAQLSITMTGGSLTVCELMGVVTSDSE